MFSFFASKKIARRVEKALRDRHMRTGVFSFMNMATYEMERDYTMDFARSKQVKKWVRNSGEQFSPIVVEAIYEGNAELFNKLTDLYPYILSNFLNVLDTAEMKAAMYRNTDAIDTTTKRLSAYDLAQLLSDEQHQCDILFESYPIEMGNIAANINGLNEFATIRDDITHGDFSSLFLAMGTHESFHDEMRANATRYSNFVSYLSR